MSAITVLASGTVSGAGAGSAVDTSAYGTLRLSIEAHPTKMNEFARPRAHFFLETSRTGLDGSWHTISETINFYGVTSGPERPPPGGITDCEPIVADAWVRARWLVEDAGSWTLAVTGTAS